jgi:hypothetical protein
MIVVPGRTQTGCLQSRIWFVLGPSQAQSVSPLFFTWLFTEDAHGSSVHAQGSL